MESNQSKKKKLFTFEKELTVDEEEEGGEAPPSPLRTAVPRVGTVHMCRDFFLSSPPSRPCIALHFPLRVPSIRPPNFYLSPPL